MTEVTCPACKETYETTSSAPNVANHISKLAKQEAFRHYLGLTTTTIHADYLKERVTVKQVEKINFNV